MKKFAEISFFLILVLFAQNGSAQSDLSVVKVQNQYSVENLTVSNGLYNNFIFDVLQDHLGFLWLAGDNGLQKYDGYKFTLYTPDSSSVTSRKALKLYEDKRGNLWAQMKECLIRYRRERDDFIKYLFADEEKDTVSYQVTAMAEDLDSTLWVWIQNKGLYKVNFENRTFIPHIKINKWFQNIKNPIILEEGNLKGIYETRVTFPDRYYGLDLRFKFVIKRKDGTMMWEPIPNPDDPSGYGNRILTLSGDTLNLPTVSFNSKMKIETKEIETFDKSDLKPTYVKFRLNVNKLKISLSKVEEVQVRGDRLPLTWSDNLSVYSMVFDQENKVWIAFDYQGLYQLNLETGEYKEFFSSSNQINAAIRDQDGELWFGTSSGLSRYNRDKDYFENYYIDPTKKTNALNHIFRMTDDKHGSIWTISNNVKGISRFNKTKKEFIHYSKGMEAWISSVTTDGSGIVWIGNWYQGIYKLDPDAKKFSAFSVKRNEKDILDGKLILAVYEDRNGEIWFGGDMDGLYRYNRKTGKISLYKIPNGNFDTRNENYILDIFQDSKGNFWIGTTGGLCTFNSETGSFKHIRQSSSIYRGLARVSKIYEDKNGILWLTTINGLLIQLDPKTLSTENYTLNDRQILFRDFVADGHGFLWIGSAVEGGEGAVLKFDLSRKKLSYVKQLEKFNIVSLCYNDGILWCGTNGSGLVRYDIMADTKTFINTYNGLLSNSIMGLEQDNSGNLWIGTLRGLARYDPQKGIFNHYFKEDGFFTNNFTYTAHSKSENGEMIFGSSHGVVAFYPDRIRNSEYAPPIFLTDFKIQNKSGGVGRNSPLKKHISVSDEIELSHDQNDITITFASLDFHHPERIKYSFYLENYEEDWRKPGLEHTAYYTNLDPGEYVFKVKGTNSDGIWNEAGTSLKIIILPPWWKTWWAYSLYGIIIISLLYGMRKYELNRLAFKNQVKMDAVVLKERDEMDKLKSNFFANISHEFRTPLTLILGPVKQIVTRIKDDNIKEELNAIHKQAGKLLKLVNQLLDLSKIESGNMKLWTIPQDIVSATKVLVLSFSSYAERKKITLKFESADEAIIAYVDKEKWDKIITNLLSNAFKFTPEGGIITVNVFNDEEFVKIKISDTGIGIPEEKISKVFDRFYQVDGGIKREQEGTGIGLSLTKELIELHKGKIKIESVEGKGAIVLISIPSGKEHLKPGEALEQDKAFKKEIKMPENDEEIIKEGEQKIDIEFYDKDSDPLLLIVEDNTDVRKYIKDNLKDNFRTIEAINGKEGWEKSIDNIPDLIVSDVMMPGIDGFRLCEKLKTDERTSHIPVILLTAKAAKQDKIEGYETGADDYIMKPFEPDELRARVKNLIEQRRRIQEHFRERGLFELDKSEITPIDKKFLKRALNIITTHISDSSFNLDLFAKKLTVSRSVLYRKITSLTGEAPGELIRRIRIKKAAGLIEQKFGNLSEIALEVGFSNPAYFSEAFKNQFGITPSQYQYKVTQK